MTFSPTGRYVLLRLIVLVESDVCERWLAAGVFEAMAQDLRALLRVAAGRSAVQEATDESVERSYVDQGYTGENASEAQGAKLCVVKPAEAKKGFMLSPKRWVVERSFALATLCRRLVKDDVRYAQTLEGLHVAAFACLMLRRRTPCSRRRECGPD